jgi:putative transposase
VLSRVTRWPPTLLPVQFCESGGVRLPRATRPYVRIKGQSKYLYRAVDKEGHTVDFLLTPHRDRAAAEAFLHKAIRPQGLPEKITIDQSGSHTAETLDPVSLNRA